MASLQKIVSDGRDSWRLKFYFQKRRKSIGLGRFDQAAAEIAKSHVEHLIEMYNLDRPPSQKTTRWLDSLPHTIYDRLALLGIVEARKIQDMPRTLIAYMRSHIKDRADWKKPENYKQSVDHLEAFLTRDVPLAQMTKGDAERWHRWMKSERELSPNTAGQHIKRCRQMMRAAMDDGLISKNPFAGVKTDLSSDSSKNRFIDGVTAQRILGACPNHEWRVLFALVRYGGLRCPSEVLQLRWSDIDWTKNRFIVRSSKTERYGKAKRTVPMFPELAAELSSLESIVKPGTNVPLTSFVIESYRSEEVNLRVALLRIAGEAGIPAWPKPFMALRSSRRTELERTGRFANHVLNDWFGHSGQIAEKHYLQTTEDDFNSAVQSEGNSVAPSVAPSVGNRRPP